MPGFLTDLFYSHKVSMYSAKLSGSGTCVGGIFRHQF